MQLGQGEGMALVLVADVNQAKQQAVQVFKQSLGLGRSRRQRPRSSCSTSRGQGFTQGRSTSLSRNAVK